MKKGNVEIIEFYQRKGFGYRKIANLTNFPADSVKYYCRKNTEADLTNTCLNCGTAIQQTMHHKQKVFCSDSCRMKWWNRHPEMVKRKVEKHSCLYCGKDYFSHRATQKYCSRKCFYDSRRRVMISDERTDF